MRELPKIPRLDLPIDDEFYHAISALQTAADFFRCFTFHVASKNLNLTDEILTEMETTPEMAELHEQVIQAWAAWLGRD